jgi:hypothetical protein
MPKMTVGGRTLDLTAEAVLDRMREQDPEPVREHFVEMLESAFPPKQVLAAATGWDRNTFTTMEALRVLTRLGFVCQRAGSQTAQMRDAHEEALPSFDQRLRAAESGLAVAQEAIVSLAHRLAALESADTNAGPTLLAIEPGELSDQNQSPGHEIRGGKDMTMRPENWRLILAAARALTIAGQVPFTRIAVYQWIWSRHPRADHDRPTLDPTFQGMVKNAPGGPQSAGGTPLRRVARGLYVLADKTSNAGELGRVGSARA